MAKKNYLCEDAKRLLVDGIPLRRLKDGTRYFLFPLSKKDYDIVITAIKNLRIAVTDMNFYNAQIKIADWVGKWGFNPFKEGAFMGSTDVKDTDISIIEAVLDRDEGKDNVNGKDIGGYQCFCIKRFRNLSYVPHRTAKESWDCMLIAYNRPPYAIVLNLKVDKDGNRIWDADNAVQA